LKRFRDLAAHIQQAQRAQLDLIGGAADVRVRKLQTGQRHQRLFKVMRHAPDALPEFRVLFAC
jgi:hypothetical protein